MENSDDITSEIVPNCSSKKAVGSEQITMKVLKDHSITFTPILTQIINGLQLFQTVSKLPA